jgi:hypothetical protein
MIKTQQLLLHREPIKTRSRGASTVKVERSAASNAFTARSERYNRESVQVDQKKRSRRSLARRANGDGSARRACKHESRRRHRLRSRATLRRGRRLASPQLFLAVSASASSYASVIVCLERSEDSIPATIEVEDRHVHYKYWIVPLATSPEDSLPFPLKSS